MKKVLRRFARAVRYPRRYSNLVLQSFYRKFYPSRARYYPSYLQIELSTTCNMECPRCERSVMSKGILNKHTPLSYFKKLEPILPYVNFITLGAGLGEPLLNPEFWQIHNYLKSFGIKVHYTTNGLLLTKENIEKTFKYRTDSMDISLDSLKKEVYEKIRPIPHSPFDIVMQHLGEICERKRQLKSKTPTIAIGFAAQKENIEEMPSIVRFAKKIGADNVWFTALTCHNKDSVKSSLFNLDKGDIKRIFDETENLAKDLNMPIRLPKIFGVNTSKCSCPFIWEMMMLFINGDVCCCPHFRDTRKHFFCIDEGNLIKKETTMPSVILGNLNEESIEKIWNNRNYKTLRYDNKRDLNESCKKCYFRYGIH
ncbi:MAG: radical SAM protein [archaeon]